MLNPVLSKGRLQAIVLFVLLVAFWLPSGCAVVREGEVGVKSRFGRYVYYRSTPGVMAINPFVTRVFRVPIRTVNLEVNLNLPSSEGLTINTDISILYRIQPDAALKLLQTVGDEYEQSVILPVFRSASADVTARYMAKDMHSGSRADIESSIKQQMATLLQDRGIVIEAVLLKSVRLPENLSRAIEEKLQAEQDVQRMQYVLQRERQEAERRTIEAAGIRDANRIISEGLTDALLRFKAIEAYRELSQSANTKVIITDGNGTPLLTEPLSAPVFNATPLQTP